MTSYQSAIINGLLAENIDSDDLVRSANSRAQDAEIKVNQLQRAAEQVPILKTQLDYFKNQADYFKNRADYYKKLLSRPMQEIANQNGDFKKTYEAEQLVLSKWMLSQKAYAETTIQLGLSAGKTKEEIKEIYNDNVAAVLSNTTKHGNDAVTNQVLKENINKIFKNK